MGRGGHGGALGALTHRDLHRPQPASHRSYNIATGAQSWSCAAPNGASRLPPKLPRGGVCAVVRADAEPADGTGRRVRRRRYSGRGRSGWGAV
eukprot:776120-Alexandrium_andersonii.AAC.1